MIEVKNLTKYFGSIAAVRDVSFQAGNGCITGLLGHNGAGKSTTLRILYGLLRADSGSARIDSVDVLAQPAEGQKRVGVMTDAHGLYPRLTAREHIEYFARLRQIDRATIKQRTEILLHSLGMEAIADRQAQGFSQGEKMKVCLARSLIHDPGNIIMDEPTNGLDVMTTRSVRDMLNTLKAQNKTILLSSHIMQEIDMLCDQVVVIADGQVKFQGGLERLLTFSGQSNLEDAFVALSGEQ